MLHKKYLLGNATGALGIEVVDIKSARPGEVDDGFDVALAGVVGVVEEVALGLVAVCAAVLDKGSPVGGGDEAVVLGEVNDRLLVLLPGVETVSDGSSLWKYCDGSLDFIILYLKMSTEHIVIDDLRDQSRDVDASVRLAGDVETVCKILGELGEEVLERISVVRRSGIVRDVFHIIGRPLNIFKIHFYYRYYLC